MLLSCGGVFDYDAVSADRKTIICISTSSSITSGGKHGVGKLQKIRADMFFMLLTPNVERKIIVFSEKDMFEKCKAETVAGRAPKEIEFMYADIPGALRAKLVESRKKAAREVKIVIWLIEIAAGFSSTGSTLRRFDTTTKLSAGYAHRRQSSVQTTLTTGLLRAGGLAMTLLRP
jgi:hypothetical protein